MESGSCSIPSFSLLVSTHVCRVFTLQVEAWFFSWDFSSCWRNVISENHLVLFSLPFRVKEPSQIHSISHSIRQTPTDQVSKMPSEDTKHALYTSSRQNSEKKTAKVRATFLLKESTEKVEISKVDLSGGLAEAGSLKRTYYLFLGCDVKLYLMLWVTWEKFIWWREEWEYKNKHKRNASINHFIRKEQSPPKYIGAAHLPRPRGKPAEKQLWNYSSKRYLELNCAYDFLNVKLTYKLCNS